MWKFLLNQLHLMKRRERLWVMHLGTLWAMRWVKLSPMRQERLWVMQKAKA
jgi:hypothetical protein